MGDLVGQAVDGKHYFVSKKEFDRARNLSAPASERASIFATLARLNALYMIARAGSGHIGSSFSSLDLVSWLYLNEIEESAPGSAIYFSSKGHDAPGIYSVLIATGKIPEEKLHALRRLNGLPGHPDVSIGSFPTNTGSLGMGISKAKGMVLAARLKRQIQSVFVMTGDGELQEGQIWESLGFAANHRMHEITVIVDHNKLQSDTYVRQVSDLGDLQAKFRAFGWQAERCDGHDFQAIAEILERFKKIQNKPKVLIADTIKGRGVSFWESTAMAADQEFYKYHSGAPLAQEYRLAVQELIDSANEQLKVLNQRPLELETIDVGTAAKPGEQQRLIPAYSEALIAVATRNKDIVALDADLILDTGLIPFRDRFADRFFECGIAEQDMVSVAGGLALSGALPIVHSFACFLSTRPNEQIYNNATEHTKIIYVGSLAGVVPGGPGHSHQSVRDISALGAMPGMTMVEPSCAAEVGPLLDWCVDVSTGPSYIRLASVPYAIPFELPKGYRPQKGQGVFLTNGKDVMVIAYGPVMLSETVKAARELESDGLSVAVVNLPWLNIIDAHWLEKAAHGFRAILTVDNHYLKGGQGEMVAAALAGTREAGRVRIASIGITRVPACGTNAEVLAAHALDAKSIAKAIAELAADER